jgi:hypothetical protein
VHNNKKYFMKNFLSLGLKDFIVSSNVDSTNKSMSCINNYNNIFFDKMISLILKKRVKNLAISNRIFSKMSMGLLLLVVSIVFQQNAMAQLKGVSTAVTPYILPVASGVTTTSLLTVPEKIAGYKMVGIPDGLGAYDNNDGTFTLLINHELGATLGVVRAHGALGSFVSKWIIKKSDLSVISGSDLITSAYGWNTATQSLNPMPSTIAFSRFCSADLPVVNAFYNPTTGLGTQSRIFMHGEEGSPTGYQVATVVSGIDAGKAYVLGKFNVSTNGAGLTGVGAWEVALANPYPQDKTIVAANNDGGTGIMNNSVCIYQGVKTNTGTEVDKAGLTNGNLKFVNVTGSTVEIARATNITSGTAFTLNATTSTTFSRPEDGAWDPNDFSKYYFVTTDRYDQVSDGVGTNIGRSRLWRLK